jgi:transcription factor S
MAPNPYQGHPGWVLVMPFCPECKSMVYPMGGKQSCRKCGWSSDRPAKPKIITTKAEVREAVVIEEHDDARPQQVTECPKCGHDKAYFHLMQTRRSDEPPTEINQCVACGHSWRKY